MYTWNGEEFDDQTRQGATGAGLSGALAGMSSVSGFKWNGVADWLSRAAAGLYAGRDEYMSRAFDDKMQSETQARLREESAMRQEYQNEQMERLRRTQEQFDARERASEEYVAKIQQSQDPIDQAVSQNLPDPAMFESKAKFAEFAQKTREEARKHIELQQHHTAAIKILEGAGVPPTGDPAKDIESADQYRDMLMKGRYDPSVAASRENAAASRAQAAAAREALEAEREFRRQDTLADNFRADSKEYEDRQSERAKEILRLQNDLMSRMSYGPDGQIVQGMTSSAARAEAERMVDEILPQMQRPEPPRTPKPFSMSEVAEGGRLDVTIAQAMNDAYGGAFAEPEARSAISGGIAPKPKVEVNPAIGSLKQGFVLSVLETAVRAHELPPDIIQSWESGDIEFRKNLLAETTRISQERGIRPEAALILLMKQLTGQYTNALRERDGEIPHTPGPGGF